MEEKGYIKVDQYDEKCVAQMAEHYKEILRLLGEDPEREGLLKSPERIAKAMLFFTNGYDLDPEEILRSAMFHEDYKQMVVVKDIELYSLCEHHMVAVCRCRNVSPSRLKTASRKRSTRWAWLWSSRRSTCACPCAVCRSRTLSPPPATSRVPL